MKAILLAKVEIDMAGKKEELAKQIQELQKAMERKVLNCKRDSVQYVTTCCAEIERTCKTEMRDTPTNPDVSYGRKGHHPSIAGNPPAVDTGTLLQSITHSVEEKGGGEAVGYVGSILKNPDYPRYLEYGTSRMKPRPWLSTALIRCHDFMNRVFKEIFRV